MSLRDLALICGSALFLYACSDTSSVVPTTPHENEVGQQPSVASVPVERLTTISKTLGYHQGLNRNCGSGWTDYTGLFLSEVRSSNLDESTQLALYLTVRDKAEDIWLEEPEYVCTPEMMEQIRVSAEEALNEWTLVKAKLK